MQVVASSFHFVIYVLKIINMLYYGIHFIYNNVHVYLYILLLYLNKRDKTASSILRISYLRINFYSRLFYVLHMAPCDMIFDLCPPADEYTEELLSRHEEALSEVKLFYSENEQLLRKIEKRLVCVWQDLFILNYIIICSIYTLFNFYFIFINLYFYSK